MFRKSKENYAGGKKVKGFCLYCSESLANTQSKLFCCIGCRDRYEALKRKVIKQFKRQLKEEINNLNYKEEINNLNYKEIEDESIAITKVLEIIGNIKLKNLKGVKSGNSSHQ